MTEPELIYDWNAVGPIQFDTRRKVTLDDETLRDGLQSPSVVDPSIDEKIEILHLMDALGIEMANIGLPGAGLRAYADTEALAKEIAQSHLKIRPNCAARTHVPILPNYPVVGRDAFRTATGVHAAALIKAFAKGDAMLANTVYSGVPAHLFWREQIIEIGPLSGRSNVLYWLDRHAIPATEELVSRIFDAAKRSSRVLTDEELTVLSRAPVDR